jgi:hypothetical protein
MEGVLPKLTLTTISGASDRSKHPIKRIARLEIGLILTLGRLLARFPDRTITRLGDLGRLPNRITRQIPELARVECWLKPGEDVWPDCQLPQCCKSAIWAAA